MAMTMMIELFIDRWLQKADSIQINPDDLATYFDKFMTLFVVYNRLYMEATFEMWRDGSLEPTYPGNNFPDSNAAKRYTAKYLTPRNIVQSLASSSDTRQAVDDLIRILQDGSFCVLLKRPEMICDRQADETLLNKMKSSNQRDKAESILEFIHAVRCNTFHGSKSYSREQIQVLDPCIKILEKLINMLREKLIKQSNNALQ